MARLLLGLDKVVFKATWSLNTGGHKDRFYCILISEGRGYRQWMPVAESGVVTGLVLWPQITCKRWTQHRK